MQCVVSLSLEIWTNVEKHGMNQIQNTQKVQRVKPSHRTDSAHTIKKLQQRHCELIEQGVICHLLCRWVSG